jgi:hypothetical protein
VAFIITVDVVVAFKIGAVVLFTSVVVVSDVTIMAVLGIMLDMYCVSEELVELAMADGVA